MDRNHLMEIYKVEAEKYNKTRDIHWKVNIAIWTVLIVAIYATAENKLHINNVCGNVIAAAAFLLLHFLFVNQIHGSLKRSLTRMHNMATSLIAADQKHEEWKDFERPVAMSTGIWEYLQLGISFFLIVIYFLVKYS